MAINWDEVRRHKFAPESGPADWPADVKPISMDGTSLFGIDPNNRLYWDGKRIAFHLRLTWYQTFLATIAAIGAFASGVADLWMLWK